MYKAPFIFLCFFTLLSCDYFKQDVQSVPVARVNDSYLYEDDLKDLIFESTSSEDSLLIINNFITYNYYTMGKHKSTDYKLSAVEYY